MSVTIRAAAAHDEARWRTMWADYAVFYKVAIPEVVTAHTWARILDPGSPVDCVVAVDPSGATVGFAVYQSHENSWSVSPICYLEDLYVDPAARSQGAGRALIDWLWAEVEAKGWSQLYWHTDETNARAQALYDSYSPKDEVRRYSLKNPAVPAAKPLETEA